MELIRKILIESLESNRDINIVADAIIEQFVNNIKRKKKYVNTLEELLTSHSVGTTFYMVSISKYNQQLSTKGQHWVHRFNDLRIYFERDDNINAYAQYIHVLDQKTGRIEDREIVIYFDNEIIKKYEEELLEKEDYHITMFLSKYKTNLIHELQHLYDDYVSDNKIFQDKKSADFLKRERDLSNKKDAIIYLTTDEEVNARFQQFINKSVLNQYREPTKKVPGKLTDLQVLTMQMMNGIKGWQYLSSKQQRRLKERLYQEYWANIEKFKTGDLQRNKEQLNNITKDLNIKYTYYKNIVILNSADSSQTIQRLIKFANTKNMIIATDPEDVNMTKSELESMGFIDSNTINDDDRLSVALSTSKSMYFFSRRYELDNKLRESITRILKENTSEESILKDIFTRVDKEDFERYWEENNWDEDNDISNVLEYYLKDEQQLTITDQGIEFWKLDEDQEELIGDNFVILYHYTSSELVDSIKEHGLQTGFAQTNPHANSYSGIYLTTETSGNAIRGYKIKAVQEHGGNPVEIKVKMYLSELSPDPDDEDISSGDTQFIASYVSPDRILEINDNY